MPYGPDPLRLSYVLYMITGTYYTQNETLFTELCSTEGTSAQEEVTPPPSCTPEPRWD